MIFTRLVPTNGIVNATPSTASSLQGVLSIHAASNGGTPIGTAVLIGPFFALSVAHNFCKRHVRPSVTSFLSGRSGNIKRLHFQNHGVVDLTRNNETYPDLGQIGEATDEFVLLELDCTPGGTIALDPGLPQDYEGELMVAAETHDYRGLIMGTAVIRGAGTLREFRIAQSRLGDGYSEASGAPILKRNDQSGLLTVVGCHVGHDELNVQGEEWVRAYFLPIDDPATRWINETQSNVSKEQKSAVRTVAQEARSANHDARADADDIDKFHLITKLRMVYAGRLCFFKLGNLDEFVNKRWILEMTTGNIELLLVDGTVDTKKKSNGTVTVTITRPDGKGVTFDAIAAGLGKRGWLFGATTYDSRSLLVYIFLYDDSSSKKAIHVELFDLTGGKLDELPDRHQMVDGCPPMRRLTDTDREKYDWEWDQDEIGNGHEP